MRCMRHRWDGDEHAVMAVMGALGAGSFHQNAADSISRCYLPGGLPCLPVTVRLVVLQDIIKQLHMNQPGSPPFRQWVMSFQRHNLRLSVQPKASGGVPANLAQLVAETLQVRRLPYRVGPVAVLAGRHGSCCWLRSCTCCQCWPFRPEPCPAALALAMPARCHGRVPVAAAAAAASANQPAPYMCLCVQGNSPGPTLIYAQTTNEVDTLAAHLQAKGVKAVK